MLTHSPRNLEHLLSEPTTKGDVFADFTDTFDFALPQDWLDRFADWCKVVGNAPIVTPRKAGFTPLSRGIS